MQPHLGCTSAVSRLYLGCASAVPSAVPRLYFDYIYLGYIYLGYSSAITSAVPRLFLGGSSHRAMSQRHGGQQPPPDRSVAASEAVPCSLAPQIARAHTRVFSAGFGGSRRAGRLFEPVCSPCAPLAGMSRPRCSARSKHPPGAARRPTARRGGLLAAAALDAPLRLRRRCGGGAG